MNSISLQLLLGQASLAAAIPALDNGLSKKGVMGPEALMPDFAVFSGNELNNLPPDFTICSSVTSSGSAISPFQLMHKKGEPWVSIYFSPATKESKYHWMTFTVSSILPVLTNYWILFDKSDMYNAMTCNINTHSPRTSHSVNFKLD